MPIVHQPVCLMIGPVMSWPLLSARIRNMAESSVFCPSALLLNCTKIPGQNDSTSFRVDRIERPKKPTRRVAGFSNVPVTSVRSAKVAPVRFSQFSNGGMKTRTTTLGDHETGM
jgi:hypothetical protein